MSTKHLFPLLGITAFALAFSSPSFADVVQGSSSGVFSSLTGCTSTGAHPDCQLAAGNTEVKWGSTSSRTSLINPSTLTADTVAISAGANASGVMLAELTWHNSATTSSQTPFLFGVDYKLTINFTKPGTSTAVETFDLAIGNPPVVGDFISGFTLPDLSALTFDLPGETIGDLHYVAAGGSSLINLLGDEIWYNPEGNNGTLAIVADVVDPPIGVPEPASLILVASSLIGFGLLRRQAITARVR